jgi:hypothetical protein
MPNPTFRKPINDTVADLMCATHFALSETFGEAFRVLPEDQRRALVIDCMDVADEDEYQGVTPLQSVLLLRQRIGSVTNLSFYAESLTYSPRKAYDARTRI